MTDKEIIIDGVDISECPAMNTYNVFGQEDKPCCYKYHKYCNAIPICYFKQLKRKEKECEEYRKVNDEKNELLALCGITAGGERKRITYVIKELCGELQAKEQECGNYKQALDEIENYIRDNSDFDESDRLTSSSGAYDILDIINKTKED